MNRICIWMCIKRWATEFRSVCTSLAALLLISSGQIPGWKHWNRLITMEITMESTKIIKYQMISAQICTDQNWSATNHQESISTDIVSFNVRRCDGSLREMLGASEGTTKYAPKKDSWSPLLEFDFPISFVLTCVATKTILYYHWYIFVYICITYCVSAISPFQNLPSFSDLAQKERF